MELEAILVCSHEMLSIKLEIKRGRENCPHLIKEENQNSHKEYSIYGTDRFKKVNILSIKVNIRKYLYHTQITIRPII